MYKESLCIVPCWLPHDPPALSPSLSPADAPSVVRKAHHLHLHTHTHSHILTNSNFFFSRSYTASSCSYRDAQNIDKFSTLIDRFDWLID